MIKKILLSAVIATTLFAVEVGKKPNDVTISGDNGGMVSDDSAWNSKSMQGKVHVMFYVDPDKKGTNESFTKELKQLKKSGDADFQSIAIINLAATWKPNFVIQKILKSKQKEFPDTIYVYDKNSVLVKKWGLEDDAYNVVIFDKDGTVLFAYAGELSDAQKQKTFEIIKKASK